MTPLRKFAYDRGGRDSFRFLDLSQMDNLNGQISA